MTTSTTAGGREPGGAATDAAPPAPGRWVSQSTAGPAWDCAGLEQRLADIEPGLRVAVVAEVGSTNTALVELARTEAPGPARPRLLVAERQLQGRGRQGRAWQSAPGASLTFSLALPMAPVDWSGLSLAVGVALAEALDPARPGSPTRLGLKWPNDLWLRDGPGSAAPGRKLGGILIETVACGAQRVCVVGVGLNLAPQAVTELSSGFACLRELEPDLDRAPRVLELVAPPLLQALRAFEREGLGSFAAAYAARDLLCGHPVRTTLAAVPVGRAEGVDASGALRVVDRQGVVHPVNGGEVSIRFDADQAPRRD